MIDLLRPCRRTEILGDVQKDLLDIIVEAAHKGELPATQVDEILERIAQKQKARAEVEQASDFLQ